MQKAMKRQSSQEAKRSTNHFWIKVPRFDSYFFLRILVAFNVVLFIFYVVSIQDIQRNKSSTNPCIVLIDTKDSEKVQNNNNDDSKNVEEFVNKVNEKASNLIDNGVINNKNVLPIEPQQQQQIQQQEQQLQQQNNINQESVEIEKYWWTTETRGKFSVIRNYIPGDETAVDISKTGATLTTQGTYEYLHHSEQLCQRWDGFISIGVYSPGYDFKLAVNLILFLRQCSDSCVKRNISWHLVYESEYGPALSGIAFPESYVDDIMFDCSTDSVETITAKFNTNFRKDHSLPYPINVVRNVARLSAKTKYVFASDIELYPSINIVSMFADLLERERTKLMPAYLNNNHVYVVPIFEVSEGVEPPKTKFELKSLIEDGKAIFFHKWVCDICQKFPDRDKWINDLPLNKTLNVFRLTRRFKKQSSWEPLYIGTNDEPLYDERLTWDGKRDKMTQMYEMCMMSYDLAVLDNAFLVHAPGIKKPDEDEEARRLPFIESNKKIHLQVKGQLARKYGNRKC